MKINASQVHVIDEHIRQCAVDCCIAAEVVEQLEVESIKMANEKLRKEVAAIVFLPASTKSWTPGEIFLRKDHLNSIFQSRHR